MNWSAASVEKLIRVAFSYGLVDDYRMTSQHVELACGHASTALDPEEARIYLQGLLQGYEAAIGGSSRWQC